MHLIVLCVRCLSLNVDRRTQWLARTLSLAGAVKQLLCTIFLDSMHALATAAQSPKANRLHSLYASCATKLSLI